MPRLIFRIAVCSAFAAALVATAYAQTDKKSKKEQAGLRVVQGTVVDGDEKPIQGAVVRLKDTAGIRTFITREDGSYHFSGLKVDVNYELKADFDKLGSKWKRLSVFDERKTAIINFKLEKQDSNKQDKGEPDKSKQ